VDAKNLGVYLSCTEPERIAEWIEFELIQTVKWKLDITSHHHIFVFVQGHLGSEFPAICNRCRIAA